MHRRITPSLIEETAILIQDIEEIKVGLRSQPIKVPNLKIGPLFMFISREVCDAQGISLQNGNGCRSLRRHRLTSPWHCLQECVLDVVS